MWKGATVAAAFLLLGACAQQVKEQQKAQAEEFAKAAREAEAQIAEEDDARCRSYGKRGSYAYIDCRTSLKIDRAEMGAFTQGGAPKK
jgi:outer membrane biogenesis lipoprotein LolB